jgi:RHS repeat-associated protein
MGEYTAFGEVSVSVSDVTNNFRFPGQYWDGETDLYYNFHRYYDPGIGKYMREDPIGLIGDINLFVYTRNNPVIRIDPLGLKWVWYCKRRLYPAGPWYSSFIRMAIYPMFGHCYIKFGSDARGFYPGSEYWEVHKEEERWLIINRLVLSMVCRRLYI